MGKHQYLNKSILLVTILIFSASLYSQKDINWVSIKNLDKALNEQPRHVFITVYTEWCDHCEHFQNTTLQNKEIISYINSNFLAIKFNAESNDTISFKNRVYVGSAPGQPGSKHQLALQLAVFDKAIGFPTFIFLDKDLNKIMKPVRGYKNVGSLKKYLQFVNEQIYISKSFEEYEETYNSRCKSSDEQIPNKNTTVICEE